MGNSLLGYGNSTNNSLTVEQVLLFPFECKQVAQKGQQRPVDNTMDMNTAADRSKDNRIRNSGNQSYRNNLDYSNLD